MLNKRQFYIDGHWVDPVQGTDCEVIDPSTEEPVAVISLGGQADTNAAVAAAKAALPEWSERPAAERADYVRRILEAYATVPARLPIHSQPPSLWRAKGSLCD